VYVYQNILTSRWLPQLNQEEGNRPNNNVINKQFVTHPMSPAMMTSKCKSVKIEIVDAGKHC